MIKGDEETTQKSSQQHWIQKAYIRVLLSMRRKRNQNIKNLLRMAVAAVQVLAPLCTEGCGAPQPTWEGLLAFNEHLLLSQATQ